ncbi:unnamed protein product, partial [Polarella glacialis]
SEQCTGGLRICCGELDEDNWTAFRGTGGAVRILIVALEYQYVPEAVLTCHKDARTIFRVAKRAGVEDITVVTDKQGVGSPGFPTRRVVLGHIRQVASRCQPGDWFVWFWAGHGVNIPDENGDEESGWDQAFVTPNDKGQLTAAALLVDDQFAKALDTYVPDGVRILCICDCCHSGTICDIDSYLYRHEIYQISASQDNEEAEDIGIGGVLSTALRRAVRKLSIKYGSQEFSIQDVFDSCKKYARRMTDAQELSFQFSGGDPGKTAWPLAFPWWHYLQKPSLMVKLNIHDYEEDGVETDDEGEWAKLVGPSPGSAAAAVAAPPSSVRVQIFPQPVPHFGGLGIRDLACRG